MSTNDHHAILIRNDMLSIADDWDELETLLGESGNSDRSGVHTPPSSRPPINAHISDVKHDVVTWVTFLARILITETADHWTPRDYTTPGLLREIANERIGHFTTHPDQALAQAVADDAAELSRKVARTVRPSGRRTVRLGVPCTSLIADTDTPCPGQYTTVLDPTERLGDLVCTKNDTHRMTPLEWQRAQKHDTSRARDLDALLHQARVRHTA